MKDYPIASVLVLERLSDNSQIEPLTTKVMNIKLGSVAGVLAAIFTFGLIFSQKAGASIQFTNEFWICTNATGNFPWNGTGGTLDNPYDGSNFTNFDGCMNYLCNARPNSTIHILAGTYQTKGATGGGPGWSFTQSNIKVLGSGIDITTLKIVDDPSVWQCVVMATAGHQTNIEVSDLTLDGNYTSGSYNRHGIELDGTHHTIRRVKVINCAKMNSGNSEGWGIVIANFSFPDSSGNIIEECEFSQFAGALPYNGINGLALNGHISGIVRNNHVYGSGPVAGVTGLIGGCSHDVLIEGNFFKDVPVGWYAEGPGSTNIIFAHNHIINCGQAVALTIGKRQNLTFAFNDIVITNSPAYDVEAIYLLDSGSNGNPTYTNVTIFGNTVGLVGPSGGNFLNLNKATGIIVAYNTVDSRLGNVFNNCANMNIDNNYDLSGNYLSSLNVPTLGGTPATSYGISLASSAGASSALTTLGLPSNPLVLVTNGSSQTITFNTNFIVNGNIIQSAGKAYIYDGQKLAYGITSLSDYFFGNAGNFTMTGTDNTAIGHLALISDTTGFGNTAVGRGVLYSNTTGFFNTANGVSALHNNTIGSYNTANGVGALGNNYGGYYNSANGQQALGNNIDGAMNTANGVQALFLNANGSYNTANGGLALYNTINSGNTADGYLTLFSNTVGSYNIAIGYTAGYNITTGSSNIDIGNIGASTDANIIRIGTSQSDAFIAGTIHGNGSALTGITTSQVGAAAATNAMIWDSITITNSAAANWATLTVTPSNAVIGVHGVNVAVLQTNGVLNAINGLSTTISNTLPAATIVSGGTSNLNWTNTVSRNVVVYIDNLAGSVKYNGSPIFSTAANLSVTVLLQPNDYVAITRNSGSYNAYWHPF